MRGGHAKGLQNCGERMKARGKLGEAMLHEAVTDDQAQWNWSPASDRRSADQIDGKIAPRGRLFLDIACRLHIKSSFLGLRVHFHAGYGGNSSRVHSLAYAPMLQIRCISTLRACRKTAAHID